MFQELDGGISGTENDLTLSSVSSKPIGLTPNSSCASEESEEVSLYEQSVSSPEMAQAANGHAKDAGSETTTKRKSRKAGKPRDPPPQRMYHCIIVKTCNHILTSTTISISSTLQQQYTGDFGPLYNKL